ncbi:hypothetical protein LUZ60_003922 [Juncus effusus]|nr:hypothetical protein LUZ60_003922 [Juncus effusus]
MGETTIPKLSDNRVFKCLFSVIGIMSSLVIYGILQEKIMKVPYGNKKEERFKYSLFLVFCNRLTTSTVSAVVLLATNKSVNPVAPISRYAVVSVSNIIATTCQYEALKYVSFPVQTLAKCAKMIPVMLWGSVIMQKKYNIKDYLVAVFVTVGCSLFILYPDSGDISILEKARESTVLGVLLMLGYLGFDGFTSTFQDKLFKGYDMEIQNQLFFTTTCSCLISLFSLMFQGHLIPAVEFIFRNPDCFYDVIILSSVATASQFFISYTIRNFGALTFAIIMTTRQVIVFGTLYAKSLLRNKPEKPVLPTNSEPDATNSNKS